MKTLLLVVISLSFLTFSGCSQTTSNKQVSKQTLGKHVGGSCEGCEAIYESPVPFKELPNVATLPDFNEKGPKIELSGIVYQSDGKTPAKDVVLYIYHTDQSGNYSTRGDEKGWAKRHGYIRGWVKTDANGHYKFYTLRPASYPNSKVPQHIHVTVKEPDKNEYWIDSYEFADDPFLEKNVNGRKPVGGNGIITLKEKNGILSATRNIILGLNVRDYPTASFHKKSEKDLTLGYTLPAFVSMHFFSQIKKSKPRCI